MPGGTHRIATLFVGIDLRIDAVSCHSLNGITVYFGRKKFEMALTQRDLGIDAKQRCPELFAAPVSFFGNHACALHDPTWPTVR